LVTQIDFLTKTDSNDIMKKRLLTWLSIILTLIIGGLFTMSCMSSRPNTLGIKNGKLAPCPSSPNCVCSYTDKNDQRHSIGALSYDESEEDILSKLKLVITNIPRSEVITETENYIHAEFTSLLFRFVDDLEIYLDSENKLIHFRSASRVGHSDFGVNRKRIEKIKSLLLSQTND
jgi:uncharacterized protein (DUF1499 family)